MPYPHTQSRKALEEADYAIYAAALAVLAPEVIEAACEKYMQVGKFFPLPADILGMLKAPENSVHALIAEEAWNSAIDWVHKWYLGDLGVDRRSPPMDEKQRRAIIAAGGFEHVTICTLDELQWAKKRFLENYEHQETVDKDGNLIGASEAKKILDVFRRPALPPIFR